MKFRNGTVLKRVLKLSFAIKASSSTAVLTYVNANGMMEILDTYSDREDDVAYFDCCTSSPNSNSERKSSGSDLSDDRKYDSVNGLPPSESKDNQENKKYLRKIKQIQSVLLRKPLDLKRLKQLAVSEGGLVNDEIRKAAWPLLLELSDCDAPKSFSEEKLKSHPEHQQVVLDVNRCLRRFPPGIPLPQRLALQNQLTLLILRVVTAHPRLKYYQGYHDVAVTLLLVTGLDTAFLILEKLSTHHLKECMEPTMEKTSHLLNYVFPLVRHQNEQVFDYLEKSGVGNMFALPWFLTWFGHSLNQYNNVVRLFDYFLASEPLSPLYLSAVIIAFRSEEILSTPCDMANLHSLLSQIPDDLPFEELLAKTTELYLKHPPEHVQKEALERTRQEEEQRKKEYAVRRHRMNQNLPLIWRVVGHLDPDRRLPIWALIHPNRLRHFSRYRYLMATATFAVGLYAVYLKTVEAKQLPEEGLLALEMAL